MQSLVNIILSVGVTAAVVAGAVVWILREWISSRIKANIQHKYEISTLELKNKIEKDIALYKTSQQSFAEGQKASMERKLNSIDKLWERVMRFSKILPPEMSFVDNLNIIEIEKYKDMKRDIYFKKLKIKWSEEEFNEKRDSVSDDKNDLIEKIRPYVGEHLWAIFCSMKEIYLRLSHTLQFGDDEKKIEWHKDEAIRTIIESVLTKDELIEFDRLKFGKFTRLQQKLESKMLTEIQKIISGEHFSAESLREAEKIQQKIASAKLVEKQKDRYQ